MKSAPFVVRFGPWARNLYLGLPAMAAFGLISIVAPMPLWFAWSWRAFVGFFAVICAFPRDIRFNADGSVVTTVRVLALLPVWRRSYPRSSLRQLRLEGGSHRFVGEAEVSADTVWLVLTNGRRLAVQSYSSGAENTPPLPELIESVRAATGLPVV